MSYRTYINGHQWLGNNNFPKVIEDELKRQGCVFDADGVVESFEVKDVQSLIEATEQYIISLCKDDKEVADFNNLIESPFPYDTLTFALNNVLKYGYIFVSVNLIKYIGEENLELVFDKERKHFIYKLRENAKCIFKAY